MKMIPKEKLSKKAKKALAAKQRTLWTTNPISKKVESKKIYNRKRTHVGGDDPGMRPFCLI